MFYLFLTQITSSCRLLHSFCNIKLKYLPKHCKQRHYIAWCRLHTILALYVVQTQRLTLKLMLTIRNTILHFFLNRKNILDQNRDYAPLIIETVI